MRHVSQHGVFDRRFDELELDVAEADAGDPHAVLGLVFHLGAVEAEHAAVKRQRLVEVLDVDTEMIEADGHRRRS